MSQTFNLSDTVVEQVQRLVRNGDYPDPESVLADAVGRLVIERRQREIAASVHQAIRAMDQGRIHPESDDLWIGIHDRAQAKAGSGEPFDPDVIP